MKETPETWLSYTCDECTINELKTICINRGFAAPPKSGGKDALANYVQLRLLSSQGVQQAFQALPRKHQIILHLLKLTNSPVNIEKLYPLFSIKMSYYSSASDYRQAFLSIKEKLVLSGLVLFNQLSHEYLWTSKTKWQFYDFLLSPEVSGILPPPTWNVSKPEKPAKAANIETVLRARLDDDINKKPTTQNSKFHFPGFTIDQGSIGFGSKKAPLLVDVYSEICDAWLRLDSVPNESPLGLKIHKVRGYFLGQIPPEHGITYAKLTAIFSACFCAFKDANSENFLVVGKKFGFISSAKEKEDILLIPDLKPELPMPFIKTTELAESKDAIRIQPGTDCNLSALFLLAKLSEVSLDSGRIRMKPSIVKIGQNLPEIGKTDFIKQLKNHSPLLRKTMAEVKRRSGKFTVHANVCVIKLGGLDIKATLSKGSGKLLVDLGNDYYAVTKKDLPTVVNQARKKGFTPKYIKPN